MDSMAAKVAKGRINVGAKRYGVYGERIQLDASVMSVSRQSHMTCGTVTACHGVPSDEDPFKLI